MVALAGCSTGVAQEDYDAIVAELEDVRARLAEAQQKDDVPETIIPSAEPSEAPEPSENPSIEPSEEPSPDPSPSLEPVNTYGRTNPAPVGEPQTIDIDSYSATYTATVCITETIRGAQAWEMIKEANMFNDEAIEGYEYILAKITISVEDVVDDIAVKVSLSMFDCFSVDNAEYSEFFSIVEPEPKLNAQLYSGASTEGWGTFMVKTTDTAPKCVFEANYDGSGGLWFSLV